MDVNINEIESTVHAVDSETLLSPRTLKKIVQVVLDAVREQEEHRMRVQAEQRISAGVQQELDEDWR